MGSTLISLLWIACWIKNLDEVECSCAKHYALNSMFFWPYSSALVDAIMAIKFEYGVKKNWMGDPCFPTKYAWDGVKCSNTSGNTTRITSLWVFQTLFLRSYVAILRVLAYYLCIWFMVDYKFSCRDLTNSYLHGAISKNFTLLTALENL